MNEYRQRHETKRFAFEAELPPRKPGGKPRFVAFGKMATSATNNAEGGREALVFATPLGDFKPRAKRLRMPDGTRRTLPVSAEGARLAARASVDLEQSIRVDVEMALASGGDLACRPGMRVVPTLTRAVRSIPYKGAIIKWGCVEDLIQALATGAL